MQPIARDGLTTEQVVSLLQDSPALQVSAGLELLNPLLQVLEDITDDFAGGAVTRESYANLHGDAELNISKELHWGTAIVRPYMVVTDGVLTARFNLGAYYTSTPAYELEEFPQTFAVRGYDILHALADPIGETFSVDEGTAYLTAVESVLNDRGFAAGTYIIDQTAMATVLPSARVWLIDESITYLTVVNDLLASVGYQGIWSDWNGLLRAQPYLNPNDRASEWVYDTGPTTSMLTTKRTVVNDFYNAPNRWVGVRSNNVDGPAPVEGDGVYTFVNETEGLTSVEARGGRVISRILMLDVADQAALVARVEQAVDADLRLKMTIELGTSPNPLHWHFDRMTVNDPSIGAYVNVLGTKWTLPLNGDNMTHSWTFL